MNIREVLDGIISSYYYRKYMGTGKYSLYLLKNIRKTSLKDFISMIEEYTARFNHKYTVFLTGEMVKKHPAFALRLKELGHEIGYHSYQHISSLSQSDKQFQDSLIKGKKIFEDLNIPLFGYRAPHLLFDERHYSILKRYGFIYSSSKYFSKAYYEIIDGFYEVPVTFLDIFDCKKGVPLNSLKEEFSLKSVHLYHPYGLFAKQRKKDAADLFSSIEVPAITVSELLKGKPGLCITVDIGV